MRNNGGFILIKINKTLGNITADDFDKSVIKECFNNKSFKPMILQTRDKAIILLPTIGPNSTTYDYQRTNGYNSGGSFIVSEYEHIVVAYVKSVDTVTFEHNQWEE